MLHALILNGPYSTDYTHIVKPYPRRCNIHALLSYGTGPVLSPPPPPSRTRLARARAAPASPAAPTAAAPAPSAPRPSSSASAPPAHSQAGCERGPAPHLSRPLALSRAASRSCSFSSRSSSSCAPGDGRRRGREVTRPCRRSAASGRRRRAADAAGELFHGRRRGGTCSQG